MKEVKLFRAHSIVKSSENDSIHIFWVNQSQKDYNYRDLVVDYDDIDEGIKYLPKMELNALFSESEIKRLQDFLKITYNIDVMIEELPLPINYHFNEVDATQTESEEENEIEEEYERGQLWSCIQYTIELSTLDNYTLPFKVKGEYYTPILELIN